VEDHNFFLMFLFFFCEKGDGKVGDAGRIMRQVLGRRKLGGESKSKDGVDEARVIKQDGEN